MPNLRAKKLRAGEYEIRDNRGWFSYRIVQRSPNDWEVFKHEGREIAGQTYFIDRGLSEGRFSSKRSALGFVSMRISRYDK